MFERKDIKKLREKLTMTQYEFAQTLGVTVTTVSEWERNCNKAISKRFQRKLDEIAKSVKF